MKTIHDMELVSRIWENPLETIGQRDNRLFECYCMPFRYYRKIENEEILEKHLKKYPSIRKSIERDFKTSLGTAAWTRPLGYISEDNRELYERSMNYIFEYDEKYPNPEGIQICYQIREDMESFDFKLRLSYIGHLPPLHFGIADFSCLRAYIDGYFALKAQYGISYSDFEKKLLKFINKYKKGKIDSYQTWDRNYRGRWDFEVFGGSQSRAISWFLQDLEKFTGEKINPIFNNKEVNIDWKNYYPTYPKIEID